MTPTYGERGQCPTCKEKHGEHQDDCPYGSAVDRFHTDMQSIAGMDDDEYAEFCQIMQRRLAGHPHEHTRFCGHLEVLS